MRAFRICWQLVALWAVWGVAETTLAAPPWQALIPFKQIDADPNKSYAVTEQAGPWMILCTTFAGPGAEDEAHALVLELRSRFKLNAFTHKQHYDFTEKQAGLGFDPYGNPKQMVSKQNAKFDEIAVLVGNFPAVDDAKLQRTLEELKYARPNCIGLQTGKTTTQRFIGLRDFQRRYMSNEKEKTKGPMGKAFATRNPLLPDDFFAPKGVDSLVRDMNDGVEFSLLKCPGKYSVQIARFTGSVTIDQRKIREIEAKGGQLTNRLEEAAVKAHRMAGALRKQGIEAYEFHDREASIVTVGSFDSVGTPRADGKTEINPAVHRIMQEFGPQKVQLPGQAAGLQPKRVDGISCDVQPLPVEVPRVSVAADYARGGLFR